MVFSRRKMVEVDWSGLTPARKSCGELLDARDAGLGWETITYQGEDGNRYELSVNKEGSPL